MLTLVNFDKSSGSGFACFGDGRVYDFDAVAYFHGGFKPRWNVRNLRRDGKSAVNPTRGGLIEKAMQVSFPN